MNYISYIIPIVSLLGLVYIGLRYINLFIKINQLEHEFSTIVNHTFRTPLTRIRWLSKELESNITNIERVSYIKKINAATEQILMMIDIVAVIKKNKKVSLYSLKSISVKDLIDISIKKFKQEISKKNIHLKIFKNNEDVLLFVDIKKISFIIDTIIENAIFYNRIDGKIEIKYSITNNYITIKFIDNGIGLTFIDKLRIFSRFYRNKKAQLLNTDGMGLSLYLSKQIIKRHNGKIKAISSGVNKGSIFSIKLPLKK